MDFHFLHDGFGRKVKDDLKLCRRAKFCCYDAISPFLGCWSNIRTHIGAHQLTWWCCAWSRKLQPESTERKNILFTTDTTNDQCTPLLPQTLYYTRHGWAPLVYSTHNTKYEPFWQLSWSYILAKYHHLVPFQETKKKRRQDERVVLIK